MSNSNTETPITLRDFFFHSASQLIVCIPCATAILPGANAFSNHCRNLHTSTPRHSVAELLKSFEEVFESQVDDADAGTEGVKEAELYRNEEHHNAIWRPLNPIPLVCVESGLKCPVCPRVFAGGRQLRRHCVEVGHGLSSIALAQPVTIQAAFNSRFHRFFFPVVTPEDTADAPNELTDMLQAPASTSTFIEREACDFVNIVQPVQRLRYVGVTAHWAVILNAGMKSDKCCFVQSIVPRLSNALSAYCGFAQKVASRRGFSTTDSVRDAVSTPGIKEKTQRFRFLPENTLNRYVQHCMRIMLFLTRVYTLRKLNLDEGLGRILLPKPLFEACRDLMHHISHGCKPCEFHPRCSIEECDAVARLSFESVVGADFKRVLTSRETAQPTGGTTDTCSNEANPSINADLKSNIKSHQNADCGDQESLKEAIHAIFRILKEFFFQPINVNEGAAPTVAQSFLSCILLVNRGSEVGYCEGRMISDLLAASLHLTSLTAILRVYQWPEQGDSNTELEAVSQNLQPGKGLGVHEFVSILAQTKMTRSKEKAIPCWMPCKEENHSLCGFVHGHHLSMEEVGKTIRSMQSAFLSELIGNGGIFQSDILGARFLENVRGMKDDPHETSSGYSFLCHPDNRDVRTEANRILKRFLTDIHQKDEVEKFKFMQRVLDTFDSLSLILTGLIHLSSGMCGRGSELVPLPICNSAANPHRSFFFLNGRLVIFPFHTKTRNFERGMSRITSRHPDKTTTELFKIFVLFVVPIRSVFRQKMYMMENGSLPRDPDRLEEVRATRFIISNESYRRNITGALANCWKKHGLQLTMRYFRQWSSGVSRLLAVSNQDIAFAIRYVEGPDGIEQDDDSTNPDAAIQNTLTLQASHSTEIARKHYAREVSSVLNGHGTDGQDLIRFMSASDAWVESLGISQSHITKLVRAHEIVKSHNVNKKPSEPESVALKNPWKEGYVTTPENSSNIQNNKDSEMKDLSKESGTETYIPATNTEPCAEMETNTVSRECQNKEQNDKIVTPAGDRATSLSIRATQKQKEQSSGNAVEINGTDDNPLLGMSPLTPASQIRTQPLLHRDAQHEQRETSASVGHISPKVHGNLRRKLFHGRNDEPPAKKVCTADVSDEEAITALKAGLGLNNTKRDVQFRSREQGMAMKEVISRDRDLLIVDRTGGGKSATIFGPCMIEQGMTIFLVPLKSLRSDMERRCTEVQLPNYSISDIGRTVPFEQLTRGVVFCSPEDCSSGRLVDIVKTLLAIGKLNRVVIDEVHLIFLSEIFRTCMASLHFLRPTEVMDSHTIPVVMMSATVPPHLESKMINATGVDPTKTKVIRGALRRSNVVVSAENLGKSISRNDMGQHVIQGVYNEIRKCRFGRGRHIIAVISRDDVSMVSEMMTKMIQENPGRSHETVILTYHSGLESSEKSRNQQKWNEKRAQNTDVIMVCTSAFGTGIDAPDVRTVTVAGSVRSLIELAQVMGRIGRDGSQGLCHILYSANSLARCGVRDPDAQKLLQDFSVWVENTTECRHVGLDRYNGCSGKLPACKDVSDRNHALCDVCRHPEKGGASVREAVLSTPINPEASKSKFIPRTLSTLHPEHGKPNSSDTFFRRLSPREQFALLNELREMAKIIDRHCIPCILRIGRACNRTYTGIPGHGHGPRCSRGHCLKCNGEGHDATMCTTVKQLWKGKCFVCGLRTMNGAYVHQGRGTPDNEYGSIRKCPFKNVMKLCLGVLQDNHLKHTVNQNKCFPLKNTIVENSEWLIQDNSSSRPGIFVVVPVLFKLLKFVEFNK